MQGASSVSRVHYSEVQLYYIRIQRNTILYYAYANMHVQFATYRYHVDFMASNIMDLDRCMQVEWPCMQNICMLARANFNGEELWGGCIIDCMHENPLQLWIHVNCQPYACIYTMQLYTQCHICIVHAVACMSFFADKLVGLGMAAA